MALDEMRIPENAVEARKALAAEQLASPPPEPRSPRPPRPAQRRPREEREPRDRDREPEAPWARLLPAPSLRHGRPLGSSLPQKRVPRGESWASSASP